MILSKIINIIKKIKKEKIKLIFIILLLKEFCSFFKKNAKIIKFYMYITNNFVNWIEKLIIIIIEL